MTSYCNFCLGVFCYLLGNLPPMLRSSLKVIQLVSIVCHSTLMKYGVDKILEPFITAVKCFEKVSCDGFCIHYNF